MVDSSVQGQKVLRSFLPLESLLWSLMTARGTVRLPDQGVASGRRNHQLVVDTDEALDLPDRGPITPEPIGTDRVWDTVISQKSHHECIGGLGIAVSLEHESSTKPGSATALQSECLGPSTIVQTSSRSHP